MPPSSSKKLRRHRDRPLVVPNQNESGEQLNGTRHHHDHLLGLEVGENDGQQRVMELARAWTASRCINNTRTRAASELELAVSFFTARVRVPTVSKVTKRMTTLRWGHRACAQRSWIEQHQAGPGRPALEPLSPPCGRRHGVQCHALIARPWGPMMHGGRGLVRRSVR